MKAETKQEEENRIREEFDRENFYFSIFFVILCLIAIIQYS